MVDDRIRVIIDSQDPEIVDDLRHHNPGRTPKYEIFWEECRKYLEDTVETAVDDQRHRETTHLAFEICLNRFQLDVQKVLKFQASSGYAFSFGPRIHQIKTPYSTPVN